MLTLTPLELSAEAIRRIKANPESHNQLCWHDMSTATSDHPCGTAHCYAGHIDMIIFELTRVQPNTIDGELRHDVQSVLRLNNHQWGEIVDLFNSVARIEAFHNMFFVNGIFGENGYDSDGYNEYGYDCDGFNASGFNIDGYDRKGFNGLGYDRDGFDQKGYNKYGFHKSDDDL